MVCRRCGNVSGVVLLLMFLSSACNGGANSSSGAPPTGRPSVASSDASSELASTADPQASAGCQLRILNADPASVSTQILLDGQSIADSLDFSYDTGYLTSTNSIASLAVRENNNSSELKLELPCASGQYQTIFLHLTDRWSTTIIDATAAMPAENFRTRFINLSHHFPSLAVQLLGPPVGATPAIQASLELERGIPSEYQTFSDASYPYLATVNGVELLRAEEIPCFSQESCTVTFLDSTEAGQLLSVVVADGPPPVDDGLDARTRAR